MRPTIEELMERNIATITIPKHGQIDLENGQGGGKCAEEENPKEEEENAKLKLGWFKGVYVKCLLNIWGVMLFLRLSWVVGQAGILEGLCIITLANLVTLITAISMSAVSTNGKIKGTALFKQI